MLKFRTCAILGLFVLGTSPAFSQSIDLLNGTTHSAFRDTSNMWSSQLSYRTNLMTGGEEEGERYLNQVVVTPGANWDTNLTLQAVSGSFSYRDYNTNQYKSYTLGTAIAPDSDWEFNAAYRFGDVDGSVADGFYEATLEFIGGDSASASDVLASYEISLEVLQSLDLSVGFLASPDTIGLGESTQLTMTVENNMSDRDFITDSWYTTSFTNGSESLTLNSFNGNWFGRTIAPGDSRTDLHSTWSASGSQAAGIYMGEHGVIGGLYQGDGYLFSGSPPATVGVVPGPGSLIVMGAGLLMGIPGLRLRRRKTPVA